SAFFGAAGAFLASASAGAPSSLGLRSVRTSGSAGVTVAAASAAGATSSAIGGDTVATAWPRSLTMRTPSGGRRARTASTSPVADRQVRDVGVDAPRNVGRQAGHLDLVHDEVEDALRVAHADGLAHRMHRYAHGDGAVGADLLNVDVHELLGDGIELHVTNDG